MKLLNNTVSPKSDDGCAVRDRPGPAPLLWVVILSLFLVWFFQSSLLSGVSYSLAKANFRTESVRELSLRFLVANLILAVASLGWIAHRRMTSARARIRGVLFAIILTIIVFVILCGSTHLSFRLAEAGLVSSGPPILFSFSHIELFIPTDIFSLLPIGFFVSLLILEMYILTLVGRGVPQDSSRQAHSVHALGIGLVYSVLSRSVFLIIISIFRYYNV